MFLVLSGAVAGTCCSLFALIAPVSQIAVSVYRAGGRCLFAGTESGALRSYKLPLGPDYQEAHCCSGAITRLRLSPDDAQLHVTSADGSLFVFDVRDRDPARGVGKRRASAGQTLPHNLPYKHATSLHAILVICSCICRDCLGMDSCGMKKTCVRISHNLT